MPPSKHRSERISTRAKFAVAAFAISVYAIVFAVGNSNLLSYLNDFRMFALAMKRRHTVGGFAPGGTGDFSRSLGISDYPGSLLLDLPWAIASVVNEAWLEFAFGLTTCLALFSSVLWLMRCLRQNTTVSFLAAFCFPILMFIPSPVKWNDVAIYTASFGWVCSALTLWLALLITCTDRSRDQNFILGALVSSVVVWSQIVYMPLTIPPMVLAGVLYYCASRDSQKSAKIRVFLIASALPVLMALPLFAGYYFFGVSTIPDIAIPLNAYENRTIASTVSWILPFPDFELSAIGLWASPLPGQVGLVLLLGGATTWHLRNGARLLGWMSFLALLVCTIYSMAYWLTITFLGREIGLDPDYIEILGYPIWIASIFGGYGSRLMNFFRLSERTTLRGVLLIMLFWGGQWTVRNLELLESSPQFPISVSATTTFLEKQIRTDLENGYFSRVLIAQSQDPPERRSESRDVRRPSKFSESFITELNSRNVPILNAYSHLISPSVFEATNNAFGDGRPNLRVFSTFDTPRTRYFKSFGITYLLSEFQIFDHELVLMRRDDVLIYGTTPRTAFVYRFIDPDTSRLFNSIQIGDGTLTVHHGTRVPARITVPIEFSHCLRAVWLSTRKPVSLAASSDGLVSYSPRPNSGVEFTYWNGLLSFQNCRLKDFFAYRHAN